MFDTHLDMLVLRKECPSILLLPCFLCEGEDSPPFAAPAASETTRECHPFSTALGLSYQPCDHVSQCTGKVVGTSRCVVWDRASSDAPLVKRASPSATAGIEHCLHTAQALFCLMAELCRSIITSALGRAMWFWGRRTLITLLPDFNGQLICRGCQQKETPAYILFLT